MEVFSFLLLIFLVVVLFVVLSLKSSMSSTLLRLEQKINMLSNQLKKLESAEPLTKSLPKQPEEEHISHRAAPAPVPEKPASPEPTKLETPSTVQPEAPRVKIPEPAQPKPVTPPTRIEAPVARATPPAPRPPAPQQPGFFERNPDLEKFIGENLANKIGIAILVLGIGFFVKYAIDQNWIGEIGRVFIGILCGGILLGVAHKLRKNFAAFSSVLVGGGIAILYFTIAIAYHEYQIFSQTMAFIIMVFITGFTILLSLGYNRVELAVLAILGGFGSPFFVASGEGNYVVLFTYLLILNVGMLVLAYYKKWRLVNIICYFFTILIYGSWLSVKFQADDPAMIRNALIFVTLFYLIFFAMNIINNLKERTQFEAMEILMLLSNTFLFYSAGMIILADESVRTFQGLFTVTLGVFNFIFAYALYKNKNVDRNLVFLLIGLVLTFISLAAPIQLEGNYITLFWAAEGVLLLWLSQKSGIQLIKMASIVVNGLMCVSLAMDLKQIYFDQTAQLNIIFNKAYITSFVSAASLIITLRLLKNEADTLYFRITDYKITITFILCILIYAANFLELRYQTLEYIDSFATRTIIIGAYNMLFVLLLLLVEKRINLPEGLKLLFPGWSIIVMGAYLFFYHGYVIIARDEYLTGADSIGGFLFHYVLLALLITNVVISLRSINSQKQFAESISNAHWWVFLIFFVSVASSELDHTVLMIAFSDISTADYITEQNHKIGFPILWGLSSFLLIAIGLKRKIKTIRIISLVLLLVTLLKLFLFDLKGISEGGKILAFISLGVLLLVVSFMYQRLKKLLLDDVPAGQTENVT
jgi:uncharacterized membrane protein